MLKHTTDLIVKIAVIPFSDDIFLGVENKFEQIQKSEEPYQLYAKLKEKIYSKVSLRYQVGSIDFIYLLVNKYYPLKDIQNLSTSQIYIKQLNVLSKCFISHREGRFALKYWSNDCYDEMFEAFSDFTKVELWNSLSRQFCVDILVVNYLLENNMEDYRYLSGYYWIINNGDLQFDKILQKGVAENHIHIKAGLYFSTAWDNLLQISISDIDSHPICKEKGRKYVSRIYLASIFRLLAAHFLGKYEEKEDLFEKYISNNFKESKMADVIPLLKCMHEDREPEQRFLFKDIYENLLGEADDIRDILERRKEKVHTNTENIFLFKALQYIRNNERDRLFANMFWQYLIVKNIVYEDLTQNNYKAGLNYFQKYYKNAVGIVSTVSGKRYMKDIFLNQIYNNYLKKFEIRISPPGKSDKGRNNIRKELGENIRSILNVYLELLTIPELKDRIPELGIVIHFTKKEDIQFYEKCWCNADLETDDRYLFFGYWQKQYMETVRIINELRQTIPNLSKYVVGLDAASVENNVEPWVFAPVYQEARDSHNPMILLEQNQKLQGLGFTYHVGEEFRHIISGLRHIDEVLEHFGYHAGDRIGHGIALGIDSKSWCEENPVVLMPRIEYLENMLWLWGINTDLEIDFGYLERRILEQAQKIYHEIHGITVFELWNVYQDRFKKFIPDRKYMKMICSLDYNSKENIGYECEKGEVLCQRMPEVYAQSWNRKKLNHAYHCKCYLERMYEVIQVKVESKDAEVIQKIQKYERNKVSRKGIVIETNPTSNLAISNIERLFQHYITSLNQNDLSMEQSADGLIITVNSDDPIVFNTSTSNELAYIFYLLCYKGYSRDSVLKWIDKIRNWGMDTSFVQQEKQERTKMIHEIEQIIEDLK